MDGVMLEVWKRLEIAEKWNADNLKKEKKAMMKLEHLIQSDVCQQIVVTPT